VRHCSDNVVPRALSIQNFAWRRKYEGNAFLKWNWPKEWQVAGNARKIENICKPACEAHVATPPVPRQRSVRQYPPF